MMRPLLAAALCVSACAPATGEPASAETMPAAATPVARAGMATQIDVPTPDYARLVPKKPVMPVGEIVRDATARAPADAGAIGKLWVDRLEAEHLIDGYGLSGKTDDSPVNYISVLLTAKDFDAWLAKNGWSAPKHIGWRFVDELSQPGVTARASAKVRYWPHSKRRTGAQNGALLGGRIVLEDGCFFVERPGEERALAWFFAETGLRVDEEGFLVLVSRRTGELMGRIGEEMVWGGPNGLPPEPEAIAALKAACGPGEVYPVGNPEAREHFVTRFPHLREPRVAPQPPNR